LKATTEKCPDSSTAKKNRTDVGIERISVNCRTLTNCSYWPLQHLFMSSVQGNK